LPTREQPGQGAADAGGGVCALAVEQPESEVRDRAGKVMGDLPEAKTHAGAVVFDVARQMSAARSSRFQSWFLASFTPG
jgi:hypothetical protein